MEEGEEVEEVEKLRSGNRVTRSGEGYSPYLFD